MAAPSILLTPRASRLPVSVVAGLVCEGVTTPVAIVNLTPYGFMAETEAKLRPGQIATLTLPDEGEVEAEVRWCTGGRFGASFIRPLRTFTLARILSRT